MKKSRQVGATPKWMLSISVSGERTRNAPSEHEQQLRHEVDQRQEDVQPGRLLGAQDVDEREQGDHPDAEDDVRRAVPQGVDADDAPEVVRHEERRDGDRDDVVEHLAPCGEERPELVERMAGEARRAARLGVHRGRLGVGGGRHVEEEAGDDEDHRRQAEREAGDQAQRVVDRRTDVSVGRREQGVGAEDSLEPVETPFGHRGGSVYGARRRGLRRTAPRSPRRTSRRSAGA